MRVDIVSQSFLIVVTAMRSTSGLEHKLTVMEPFTIGHDASKTVSVSPPGEALPPEEQVLRQGEARLPVGHRLRHLDTSTARCEKRVREACIVLLLFFLSFSFDVPACSFLCHFSFWKRIKTTRNKVANGCWLAQKSTSRPWLQCLQTQWTDSSPAGF
ncbi:hypothetical protein CEXT_778091 [Caerostris extrusa]|uniref:Uncharacterized protein n=1 Tax=Caerostris extrusa TaxID=172846 RepID=A0AAV4R798_CAEEX|nr:hypothetical protein CEXT_778091 [Caerostris extrusa]